ncbi:MAG: hypothetical protein ABI690_23800 [Chloroflexota bacterium]
MKPFDELKNHYPEVIGKMDKVFNSHEFIIRLAQDYQSLYICALYEHVKGNHPFKVTHGKLAQSLEDFDNLIEKIDNKPSKNIFGESSMAIVWRKR